MTPTEKALREVTSGVRDLPEPDLRQFLMMATHVLRDSKIVSEVAAARQAVDAGKAQIQRVHAIGNPHCPCAWCL